ncbi:hypothetical protein C8Q77DRAFT_627146 [Trametes polyzona]|nr:hypothetical protein C8Q77DRAFT_627146 [Trametes polyzona]
MSPSSELPRRFIGRSAPAPAPASRPPRHGPAFRLPLFSITTPSSTQPPTPAPIVHYGYLASTDHGLPDIDAVLPRHGATPASLSVRFPRASQCAPRDVSGRGRYRLRHSAPSAAPPPPGDRDESESSGGRASRLPASGHGPSVAYPRSSGPRSLGRGRTVCARATTAAWGVRHARHGGFLDCADGGDGSHACVPEHRDSHSRGPSAQMADADALCRCTSSSSVLVSHANTAGMSPPGLGRSLTSPFPSSSSPAPNSPPPRCARPPSVLHPIYNFPQRHAQLGSARALDVMPSQWSFITVAIVGCGPHLFQRPTYALPGRVLCHAPPHLRARVLWSRAVLIATRNRGQPSHRAAGRRRSIHALCVTRSYSTSRRVIRRYGLPLARRTRDYRTRSLLPPSR